MTNEKHITAEELSSLIDGDVEESRALGIQSHLDECQACSRAADEFRALKSDLSALAEVEPRRDLWPAIQRAREPGVSWWRRFWDSWPSWSG